MKSSCGLLVLAAVIVPIHVPTTHAADTDIRTIRTEVTRAVNAACTPDSPALNDSICIKVVVENLGPDTYVGTEDTSKPAWAAGQLQVSVDIDEPTKPGKPGLRMRLAAFNTSKNFAVTIAPGDTAELDFGPVDFQPTTPGTHQVTATSTAQSPNIDNNASNNTANDTFFVSGVGGSVPAVGTWGLGATLVILAGSAFWALRRQRDAVTGSDQGSAR